MPTAALSYEWNSCAVPALPLELHWTPPMGRRPVRLRRIRPRPRRGHSHSWHVSQANGYHANGESVSPFDFSQDMSRLCADIVSRCEELHHIDVSRILFTVTQARTGRLQGLQAKVTPMRFRDGHLARRRRGRVYQVQRYWVGGVEILYLITFCLPRFLDQSFDDKFVTVFHELYHIAPAFNGDLRRHEGRYCIHTRSQKCYDKHMTGLAREYLANGADRSLHAFLRLNFSQLEARHGKVLGHVVPVPKLVPVGD